MLLAMVAAATAVSTAGSMASTTAPTEVVGCGEMLGAAAIKTTA